MGRKIDFIKPRITDQSEVWLFFHNSIFHIWLVLCSPRFILRELCIFCISSEFSSDHIVKSRVAFAVKQALDEIRTIAGYDRQSNCSGDNFLWHVHANISTDETVWT